MDTPGRVKEGRELCEAVTFPPRRDPGQLAADVFRERHLVPLQAILTGPWPAITRRQSPPSASSRLPSLHSAECDLWLGARDPGARQYHLQGHNTNLQSTP